MTSPLHEERLQAVLGAVQATGAAHIVDLGCGDGDLIIRLAGDSRFERLVCVDINAESLDRLRQRLTRIEVRAGQVDLRYASMTDPADDLNGIDCAILVESIEHIEPDQLSKLERSLFHRIRPKSVVMTTPNAEYNPVLGVPSHRFRHPGHKFEWDREKFRRWSSRAAREAGYGVVFSDIGGHHPRLGSASQMAVFRLAAPDAAPD